MADKPTLEKISEAVREMILDLQRERPEWTHEEVVEAVRCHAEDEDGDFREQVAEIAGVSLEKVSLGLCIRVIDMFWEKGSL